MGKGYSRLAEQKIPLFSVCSVADATFGRLIAFAGVHLEFLFFAFLVDDGQGTTVGCDQLHFNLVKFAVFRASRRRGGDAVLVADESDDVTKHTRPRALD